MCGADSPRRFDATHSRHVDIHQYDPSTAVPKEFDRGFTGLAFTGHNEIFRGSHGRGGSDAETGLVVDNPNSHRLILHLRIVRSPFAVHHRVHTTLLRVWTPHFYTETSSRNISTALTRRSTESSVVKPSLAKIELICFSTAR